MSELSTNPHLLEETKAELEEIDQLPSAEHAERFEGVHRTLESVLSTIEGL